MFGGFFRLQGFVTPEGRRPLFVRVVLAATLLLLRRGVPDSPICLPDYCTTTEICSSVQCQSRRSVQRASIHGGMCRNPSALTTQLEIQRSGFHIAFVSTGQAQTRGWGMLEPPRPRYLILGGSLSLFTPRQLPWQLAKRRRTMLNKEKTIIFLCAITRHWFFLHDIPWLTDFGCQIDASCSPIEMRNSRLLDSTRSGKFLLASAARLMRYAHCRKHGCTPSLHLERQKLCSACCCSRHAHSLAGSENRTWTEHAGRHDNAITPQIGDPKEAFPAFLPRSNH